MKDNRYQAFPSPEYMGMTLRDYFAGQALAGLSSAHTQEGEWTGTINMGNTAEEAYKLADAMIAERAKE